MKNLHLTYAELDLKALTYNMDLLQKCAGGRKMLPAIKANAYGHGALTIGRELEKWGCHTLCVAHASEAIELIDKGLKSKFMVLSPSLPELAPYFVGYGLEPVVCHISQVDALNRACLKKKKKISIHVKVDTGMGRVGITPNEIEDFLNTCEHFDCVFVKGIMSHFPRADEADKAYSLGQVKRIQKIINKTRRFNIGNYHFANSAAIFDFPQIHCDAVRPGISIYGMKPSDGILNPKVNELKPVLSLKSRITWIKDVPAGTGLSYGHTFHTEKRSRIATIPVGYGDGLMRILSNKLEVLVGGVRCPQVGRICMDQCLIDVTALGDKVKYGDEVVLIGKQGDQELTADEMAGKVPTINYEITTNIAARVPRKIIAG